MLTHPARHASKATDEADDALAMVVVRLMRPAAILLMGWLLLSGVLLAARTIVRVAHPLGVAPLLAAGAGLALAAWLTRSAWNVSGRGRPASALAAVLPSVVTSSALLLWGACLTRGASSLAAAIFWLMLIVEEGWGWRGQLIALGRGTSPVRRSGASVGEVLHQQFTRHVTRSGEEVVRGSLSVTIDQGSRWAAGHIAFCPPLSERPQFDVQPSAGQNATLKVSQLYPHGARIEVKLPQPAKADTTVAVQFVARAPRAMLSTG